MILLEGRCYYWRADDIVGGQMILLESWRADDIVGWHMLLLEGRCYCWSDPPF